MTEMSTQPAPQVTSCPHCGAGRSPGVTWCTQCFTVLEQDPGPARSGDPAGQDAAGVDLGGPSAWDLAQKAAAQLPEAERRARMDEALAELTGAGGQGRLGRLAGFGGTMMGKAVIMIGGTLTLVVVLYGLMSLVGFFL